MSDESRWHYYMDWVPVSSAPTVHPVSAGQLRTISGKEIVHFFGDHQDCLEAIQPYVETIEYRCRVDGIFLFRFKLKDSVYERAQILKDSDSHESEQPFDPETADIDHGLRHVIAALPNAEVEYLIQSFVVLSAKYISFGIKHRSGHVNNFHVRPTKANSRERFLLFEPVSVFDPYASEFQGLLPDHEDKFATAPFELLVEDASLLVQLRTRTPLGNISNRMGLLRLKEQFAHKLDLSVAALHLSKDNWWYNAKIKRLYYGLILLTLFLPLFFIDYEAILTEKNPILFNFGIQYLPISISLAYISLVALAIWEIRFRHYPVLQVVISSIGVLNYGHVFATIIDNLYRNQDSPGEFHTESGGFTGAIGVLQSNYKGEEIKLVRTKDRLILAGGFLTVITGVAKISGWI